MFIPIGDTPNPRNFRPWVTWALMALNVGVYLIVTLPLSAQHVSPGDPLLQDYLRNISTRLPGHVPIDALIQSLDGWDLFVYAHGYKPGAPSVQDLFTAMFMHAGFMHLAGNMLFLWIYGDNLEHRLGRVIYLLTYLGTGVAATLAFGLFAGASMVPLIGASGAISGVLGGYFVLFPRNKVKVFVALFPFILTTILVPARIVLGIFLIIDNLFPALFSSGSGGVAHGAHIGGFFAGLAVAFAIDRLHIPLPRPGAPRGKSEPAARRAPPKSPFTTVSDAEGSLRAAIRAGDHASATRQARLLHPDQVLKMLGPDALVLAEWLAEAGDAILAMTLLRRALSLPRGEIDQARVYLTLGLVRLAQGQPTAAYQHLLAVFDHDPDEETEDRAKEGLRRIAVN